jgi:hypothetical protein
MRYTSIVKAMNITQERAKGREKMRVELYVRIYGWDRSKLLQ